MPTNTLALNATPTPIVSGQNGLSLKVATLMLSNKGSADTDVDVDLLRSAQSAKVLKVQVPKGRSLNAFGDKDMGIFLEQGDQLLLSSSGEVDAVCSFESDLVVAQEVLDLNQPVTASSGGSSFDLSGFFYNYPVTRYSINPALYNDEAGFNMPPKCNIAIRLTSGGYTVHRFAPGTRVPFYKQSASLLSGLQINGWLPEIAYNELPDWVVGAGDILDGIRDYFDPPPPRRDICPCTSIGLGGVDNWCNDPNCCSEVTTHKCQAEIKLEAFGPFLLETLVCPDVCACPVVPFDSRNDFRAQSYYPGVTEGFCWCYDDSTSSRSSAIQNGRCVPCDQCDKSSSSSSSTGACDGSYFIGTESGQPLVTEDGYILAIE